jgi:hypothetical protein
VSAGNDVGRLVVAEVGAVLGVLRDHLWHDGHVEAADVIDDLVTVVEAYLRRSA